MLDVAGSSALAARAFWSNTPEPAAREMASPPRPRSTKVPDNSENSRRHSRCGSSKSLRSPNSSQSTVVRARERRAQLHLVDLLGRRAADCARPLCDPTPMWGGWPGTRTWWRSTCRDSAANSTSPIQATSPGRTQPTTTRNSSPPDWAQATRPPDRRSRRRRDEPANIRSAKVRGARDGSHHHHRHPGATTLARAPWRPSPFVPAAGSPPAGDLPASGWRRRTLRASGRACYATTRQPAAVPAQDPPLRGKPRRKRPRRRWLRPQPRAQGGDGVAVTRPRAPGITPLVPCGLRARPRIGCSRILFGIRKGSLKVNSQRSPWRL
jgi:hypothetical protein